MRLPMPLVAAGLLVLIGGLLGFGLWANRNLRPQGPTLAMTATVPAVGQTAAPTPVAATPTVVVVAPTATVQATPLLVLATATSVPATVSQATPQPTPLPTVEPTLAAEIGGAYVEYWKVTSQALLELDSTHLPDVMSGDYLQMFESKLDDLRASGRAIKTQVKLDYKVVQAGNLDAVVIDHVDDTSFYVEPGTENPLSDPADDFLSLELKLHNFDGTWKVVESVSAD